MNNTEQLTELDPAKTYVDSEGREWEYQASGEWGTPTCPMTINEETLRFCRPDLREYIPQWYEPLLEKGWVQHAYSSAVSRMGVTGYPVIITFSGDDVFNEDGGPYQIKADGFSDYGTLDNCLAAAEPLVWKGVAK